MSARPEPVLSFADFLEWEVGQETKHEFYRGGVFAMAGGSVPHSDIVGNAFFALRVALQGRGCTVSTDALAIRVEAADLYTYPDVSVVCGERSLHGTRFANTALLNPLVLVEVLSPSTASYDRGAKFDLYAQIPSLQAYVLVSQDAPSVHVYSRDGDAWRAVLTSEGEARIPCLDVALPLDALYDGVAFPGPGERTRPTPGV